MGCKVSTEFADARLGVVAKAVVNSWKRVINLEWWRSQLEEKSDQVGKLQRAWLENEERKNAGQTDSRGTKRAASVAFQIGSIDEDNLPSSSKTTPKKKVKEIHNANCVGGMRNPAYSISKLTLVRDVGLKIQGLWKEFEESHPEVVEVVRNYSKPDNKFDGNLLALWKSVLKDHLAKGDDEGMTLRENYEFCSPLDGDLWSQWRNESKDPDLDLVDFIRFGAPLGMEEKIPESGIFPKALDQNDINEDPLESFQILKETKNYKSVSEQAAEAKVEIQRYVDKGFCKRVSWEWISKEFQEGTVSKMALLIKQKPDGSTKRRIILDMRRSKGNSRASIPERIVLPRVVDVVSMLRAMWAHRPRKPPQRDADDFKFFLVDLADAFCHFPVRKAELKHCVTPDEEDKQALLWPALLFGYRGAPLIVARLSAAIGRLAQSLCETKSTQLQVYVDDMKKGEGGRRVQWIGCTIDVPPPDPSMPDAVALSISPQMVDSILEILQQWDGKGMASLKDLKSVTGKLSWLAGIVRGEIAMGSQCVLLDIGTGDKGPGGWR